MWDPGGEAIRAYRLAHDITDPHTVLGAEPIGVTRTVLSNAATGSERRQPAV